MRIITLLVFLMVVTLSCQQKKHEMSSIDPVNWKARIASIPDQDSLETGSSYLAIYSHIYSESEHRTHPLTATVSIRNVNKMDTIFLEHAEYYNTKGEMIRSYFEEPIFVRPLETVEIVIDQRDTTGGSGANFVFNWKIKPESNEPLFEAVMISTYGQQGLSFTTQGLRIK